MENKKSLAIVATIAVAGLAALSLALPQRAPAPGVSMMSEPTQNVQIMSLLDFDPTSTSTITPTPTRTPTPDATGHLPNPAVTLATRTFPGDHFPTVVTLLQDIIDATPNPTTIATIVPSLVELWAPRQGDGYGMAVRAQDIVSYLQTFGAAPQGTPRVQGYFLSSGGTPQPTPGPAVDRIAIVTTFWNQSTPVPFPTDGLWFDPTAQAVKIKPGSGTVGSNPLVFVFVASPTSQELVGIIEGKDGYYRVVELMQAHGWGSYFTFRP